MDSATRKFLTSTSEYLDDLRGRAHLPVDEKILDQLSDIEQQIRMHDRDPGLSPGLRAAVEASEALGAEVELDPLDEPSPGVRAAEDAAGIS